LTLSERERSRRGTGLRGSFSGKPWSIGVKRSGIGTNGKLAKVPSKRTAFKTEKPNPDYSEDFFIRETGIAWIILHTTFQFRL
jgi:hypothetical protein